jgi:hypothetical protein
MDFLPWLGYGASGLIALSMMMSSIIKFRWINLVGAFSFCLYGFLIGATPVFLLNGLIAFVNVYYLWAIYSRKEIFEILEIRPESEYLQRFVHFHDAEIQKIHPGFRYDPNMNTMSFFILRNMAVAGLFLAHREEGNVLVVGLDYVVPEYRDFKNGKYIYRKLKPDLLKAGIEKIKAEETTKYNESYFKKQGFRKDDHGFFTLQVK